jgi:hypothetical protein
MRELGKQSSGLEPTRDYAQFCRSRLGLDVTTGEIDSFVPEGGFDHIRLCHVVEHLRDPVANLRMVSQWLNDTGTMYVEVPDFERYCRAKTPGRMFHYGHIYNFDHSTFEFMLGLAGLEIVDRVGPTAAFLRRTSEPVKSHPERMWQIREKLEFYQQHKAGNLCIGKRFGRCIAKVSKIWREHRLIADSPDHIALAHQVAHSLRKMIHQ